MQDVVRLASPDETRAWGRRLGSCCQGGEMLLLEGGLGAGKTCLVQGLAAGLGVPPGVVVTSPTFVIHGQYQGRLRLDHMDLYRLAFLGGMVGPGGGESGDGGLTGFGAPGPALEGLGLDEWWNRQDGVCAIEWPEALGALRPAGGLVLRMSVEADDSRRMEIKAMDRRHENLARSLAGP